MIQIFCRNTGTVLLEVDAGNLVEADLSHRDLRNADLRRFNLALANLTATDLRGADLRQVNFCGADLSFASLTAADIRGANFTCAHFLATHLDGVLLDRDTLGLRA